MATTDADNFVAGVARSDGAQSPPGHMYGVY
jgi:hypothetical protein